MSKYEKQIWIDGVTPADAEHFNHMEEGIAANAEAIANLGVGGDSSNSTEITKENIEKALSYTPANETELKELRDDIYGVHLQNTVLFDSKKDGDKMSVGAYTDAGALHTPETSTNPAYTKHQHTPMLDISSGNVMIRIYSYESNGVEAEADHNIWIIQFDANKNVITGSRKKVNGSAIRPIGGGLFGMQTLKDIEEKRDGFGAGAEGMLVPAEGAKYAVLQNFKIGTDIDFEVFIDGAADSGLEPKDGIVDEVKKIRDDMEQLVPKYRPEVDDASLIATVFGNTSGSWYVTDFSAIALADLHGSVTSLDDAISIRNSLNKKPPILNAGDMLYLMPKMDNVIDPLRNGRHEIAEYMEIAKAGCVYHTMGQHEVGFKYGSMDDARTKANCMTHEEVFNTFIAPMKNAWELPDLTTNYYYKDFTTQKMRMISLYQFNVPLVDDETDNTKYKYDRNMLWLGQEQLDWLVNTLNTVPEEYKVIILMHKLEKDIEVDGTEETVFHDGKTSTMYGDYVFSGKPTMEIVQAYIDRAALNKTYVPANTDKHPADLFTVTVNADFTNAKGEFANYISGDSHVDFVGYAKNTTQRHIMLTACYTSYDCYVRPDVEGRHRSIVNLLGYDYKNSFIRIGRVGQQYSLTGQQRILDKITF